jgi:acyl-CoA reductase-like NAD-dependent aldehyde dehydrogenase
LNKYRTWARLNIEGKRVWGDVFPDGIVPVQSIATQKASLEGIKDAESVFTVNWKALTTEQQQAILEKLSEQTSATKDEILKDILKVGLPLRRRYTVNCGTTRTCEQEISERLNKA